MLHTRISCTGRAKTTLNSEFGEEWKSSADVRLMGELFVNARIAW